MVVLQAVLVLLLGCAEVLTGVIYYAPDRLPYAQLEWLKGMVHATPLSQNITFAVMIFISFLMILTVFMMLSKKERKMRKRRKKLIAVFEYYGAKYAAEDKEINF